MSHKGFSHIGLSTLDLDVTWVFYEGVLGFKPVVADTIKIKEGGHLRHVFFDVGHDQLIAFLEPNGIVGVLADYDAGINRGLGVPAASIISPSKPVRRRGSPRSATSCAPRASRPPTSSITDGRSRSTSKIPTACRSSIAASCAISPRTTRGCRSVSRSRAAHWTSTTRSTVDHSRRNRPATRARLNDRTPASRAGSIAALGSGGRFRPGTRSPLIPDHGRRQILKLP